jgi:hypothetical protein
MKELTLYDSISSAPSYIENSVEGATKYITFYGKLNMVTLTNGINNLDMVSYISRLNELKITAIRNLYKTKKLLQLDLQLAHDTISSNEYETELRNNLDNYSIELNGIESENDIYIIKRIIDEVGMERDISIDEIAEIFSIDTHSINKLI